MTLRFEDLRAAIERNDVRATAHLLRGTSESDRRSLNKDVRKLAIRDWHFQGDRAAALVAALGTAGGVRQASEIPLVPLGDWTEQAVAVLEDRQPDWLAELPKALLVRNDFRNNWFFVRALVRAGLTAKPDIPEYTTQMPSSLSQHLMHQPAGDLLGTSIEQQLLDDRDLLEDEVFRLFRVEGAAGSLYWADAWIDQPRQWQAGKWAGVQRRPEATWRATLARLARRGLISFDRLLDECIAVFLRDLRPAHFGWYVGMHDELAPTLDEMAPRAALYERLLAADISLGAGVGQRALEQLLRANRLEVESFVGASRPALGRGEKGIVVKQLKLLALAVKQRPDLAALVGEALSPALTHERAEIQEAARELAKRLPGQLASVRATAGPSAPTQHDLDTDHSTTLARAARLTDASPWAPQVRSMVETMQAVTWPSSWNIPVAAGRALAPITDPEELVEVFTRLVENASDPVEIERAIAGAVRTARIPVAQRSRAAAPLAKRAREQLPGWPSGLTSAEVRSIVASVAYTWSTGVRVTAEFDSSYREFALRHSSLDEHLRPATPTGVLAVRCIEAIELIARGAATELLAEPTHDRGAVDAEAFAERAQRNYGGLLPSSPPRYDLELAALRLRPGTMEGLLGKLPRGVRDRLSTLLREVPSKIEPSIVSAKPKDRWANAASLAVLARVPQAGGQSTVLKTLTNLEDPGGNYLRLAAEGEFSPGYGSAIRTWPLLVPWLPELSAAHLLRPLSRALQPGKHDHGPAAVACLMHPDTPLGRVGHLALAMACVGAEADTRTAAGDVFARASRDGRLQPALLSEAWLELARAGAFNAKRLESTLRPVSNMPAGGLRMAQTLQIGLGRLLEAGVRDMHALVRLAASVGDTYGVFPKDPGLESRAEQKSGTELGKALRALAEVRARHGKAPRAGSLDLLEGLLERAER